MKALLKIDYYLLPDSFIKKHRNGNTRSLECTFSDLPKYAINENGNLLETMYYLQFAGFEENEKLYPVINVSTSNPVLDEEISEQGCSNFFKNNDINLKKLLENFKPYTINEKEIWQMNPNSTIYFVVKMNFDYSYNYEYGINELYGVYCDIIGHLDNNFNLVKHKL
ncbi:MAG TPA: hypothetical protein P5509_01475 [Bacteroidales bacterium]|nr:hypothetical protein [Bacteroidales bacterium]